MDWTIPEISGDFGRLEDPYGNGVFEAEWSNWGIEGGAGGGNMKFKLSRITPYNTHVNTINKFYPKHYNVDWYIKYQ